MTLSEIIADFKKLTKFDYSYTEVYGLEKDIRSDGDCVDEYDVRQLVMQLELLKESSVYAVQMFNEDCTEVLYTNMFINLEDAVNFCKENPGCVISKEYDNLPA